MKRALLLAIGLPLLGGGIEAGNRAYRSGDARAAAAVYARRMAEGDSSAIVRYNLGTALLRMERYDQARPHLEAAAGAPVRRELAVRAHYNAGNADLEPAWRARGEGEDPKRIERLRRAIGRYKQALRLDPSDLDAKWNLEIAQKLLRQEEQSGGGGAPEEEGGGGGGEGDQNEEQQPSPGPQETPQGPGADSPQLSRAEAERILSGAASRERETQEELLGRNRGSPRPARDW
jgi:Ca-activated chloride channel family protein